MTDDHRKAVIAAGKRRARALAAVPVATEGLGRAMRAAAQNDVSVAELARLAGVTRQTVYVLIRQTSDD